MNTDWQYAWTAPSITGDLKTFDQDFYVEELLDLEADGKGEFCYLFIEKQGVNTDFLAKRLAQLADISPQKVTYSGVKDRHACTRQWFCLHLVNKQADLSTISEAFRAPESVRLIKQVRHSKKLRTGAHKGNRFVIRLRNVSGDMSELAARLELIKQAGVPNYYGPQRFGINGNNLHNGYAFVLKGRQSQRKLSKTESFWLSAIRSWCFNQSLSDQVANGSWNRLLLNDIAQQQHDSQQFRVKALTPQTLLDTLQAQVSPVLPLISEGWENGTGADRETLIKQSLVDQTPLIQGLLSFGLSRDSRLARLVPQNMAWELLDTEAKEQQLIVEFSLPKGCFATTLLREMVVVNDKSAENFHENTDR